MKKFIIILMAFLCLQFAYGEKDNLKKVKKDVMSTITFAGLKFRSIGPAFTSGRIADFAVNPKDHTEFYVATASGGIWKTINNGVTWKSVFDKYGAYSIGCLAMDPKNHNIVWAGTGENNHQRALGYGDGVYKTLDGGKTWKNMGLKNARQIGMIAIDPTNTNVVYVAAEGSVWGPGGDRGLYKTTNGGKTWKRILKISENTGVNNVLLDPRNPGVIYATSEQRRRHVFTKIGGGPETAFYKSNDGGKSWKKLTKGLPTSDMGGIGIAISPANPDVIYAIIEAANGQGGFYRSTDCGESWQKMSSHHSSGQYFNEIYCDPKDVNKVYSLETITRITLNGGKTFKILGNKARHVDDHAMWIDPNNTNHFFIGGDGGVYETFDGGKNYLFKCNLPVTQFYRVNVDNQKPFYYVYGGTQDNSSMGGPSRNKSYSGVTSCEWTITCGGDGFWTAIDPVEPNIVYAEAQYGNMVRYDRKSGESVYIRPEPRKDEKTYKWNWNTPLIISPHSHTRLYCAANKVFRSDDRGNTWQVISDDLTAKIDRNSWPVMGKYWSIDAVAKDVSTSLYGTIVSLAESPVKENLLYVGTDDGVIDISEDAKTWRKIDKFPGIPSNTYVSDILPSRFDENVVYASFDNTKRDDFKPYILKSTDKGKTWKSISNNLPQNGAVHTIFEDPVKPNLLFVGTEFGCFFSSNSGKKWIQLKNGIPTIPVEDIVVQQREGDLVLATFGRGFYILDDYIPLRYVNKELLKKDAYIFPIRKTLEYVQTRGRYGQGSTWFTAPNPPFGALITYYLKNSVKTLRAIRHLKEKKLFKEGKPIPQPTEKELRAEKNEIKPHLIFTIRDSENRIVRKITSSASKGIHRISWNLRYPSTQPIELKKKFNPLSKERRGVLVMPGEYSVDMSLYVRGKIKKLTKPVKFQVLALKDTSLPPKNRKDVVEFERSVSELTRVIIGSTRLAKNMLNEVESIKQALYNCQSDTSSLQKEASSISSELDNILFTINGKKPKASVEENPPAPVPLMQRLRHLIRAHFSSTSDITQTEKMDFEILKTEFPPILEKIRNIHDVKLKKLNKEIEAIKAPWTPDRVPELTF